MAKKTLTPIEKNKIEYDKFVTNLEGKTLEELEAMEQELIKTIDKHDRKVAKTQFKVNDKESLNKAVEIFRYFMNKQKVQFNYVLGMVQLYEAFKPDMDLLDYPIFDMCLINLGQLEFSGYEEWKKILEFEEFTKPYSEAYTELKAKTYLLAEEHTALQKKMEMLIPVTPNDGAGPDALAPEQ